MLTHIPTPESRYCWPWRGLPPTPRLSSPPPHHGRRANPLSNYKISIQKFEDCKHFARLGAHFVDRDPEDNNIYTIDELVGWRRWLTIAMDNIPRAREFICKKTALEEYARVLDARERQYHAMKEGGESNAWPSSSAIFVTEYVPAHLPQYMLRISEYIKAARDIGFHDIADQHKGRIDRYCKPADRELIAGKKLTTGVDLIEEYFNVSTIPNHRVIALLEAMSIWALHVKSPDLAQTVIRLAKNFDGKMSYGRCRAFANTWEKTLQSYIANSQATEDSKKLAQIILNGVPQQ